MTGQPLCDAVVLAGGRSTRLHGENKATVLLDGGRLVDRVLRASQEHGAKRLIVVGPSETATLPHRVVREHPPFGGPLAAIAAAIPEVTAPFMLLLSCDLVHPSDAVRQIFEVPQSEEPWWGQPHIDGAILIDADGRPQWLTGCYRTDSLRKRLREIEKVEDQPVRRLVEPLRLARVVADPHLTDDIDTPEDLRTARLIIEGAP